MTFLLPDPNKTKGTYIAVINVMLAILAFHPSICPQFTYLAVGAVSCVSYFLTNSPAISKPIPATEKEAP
jgi:hypothetical protein